MFIKRAAKLLAALFPVLILAGNADGQIPHSYQEDFTTFSYRDIVHTTAWWDVAAGELKMYPYEISAVDSLDPGNLARKIAIAGDYAYLANGGGGIEVIDISDPENISSAGTFSPIAFGSAYSLIIAGDYAFVADGSAGLTVVDISNPTSPTLAGNCDTPGYAKEIAVAGNYAYIADDDEGLRVIDISNPLLPVSAGHCSIPYDVVDVEIAGDYAYVSNYGLGLRVVDISDPTTPVEVAYINADGATFDIEADGNYLFMANGSVGLIVMDISDPENPTLAGSCDTPGNAVGVFLVGDYAYVADGTEGMQVISIADPTDPVLLYGCNTTGVTQNITVEGEYAFVADYAEGIKVIKISDIISPVFAGSTQEEIPANEIVISGNFGFVTSSYDGLKVIDISDPANPEIAGSYDTPASAYGIAIAGDHAFVADAWGGLQVLDISDPTAPSFEGSCAVSSNLRKIAISGDYAYAACSSAGLLVIDISDPTNPTLAGTYGTSGEAWDVAVSGDRAYVSEAGSLQVIDITDPTSPSHTSSIDVSGNIGAYLIKIAISGNYAYTIDRDTGLSAINITDPANPILAGSCAIGVPVYDIAVAGDYCFVASVDLLIFDISDPSTPVLIDSYDTEHYFNAAALAGDYVMVGQLGAEITAIKVFNRLVIPGGDRGQSSQVSTLFDNIVTVNLSSTQSDSITWDVCADTDSTWQTILNDGEWNPLYVTGNTLLWRSTLKPLLPGINPTCSYLQIDWLYGFAVMESIVDVPGDQGGWARIYFSPSGLDMPFEESFPIVGYNIHRRIDDPVLLGEISSRGTKISGTRPARLPADAGGIEPCMSTAEGMRYLEFDDRVFLISEPSAAVELSAAAKSSVIAAPPGTWEIVQVVFAQQEDEYIALVPTLADSSSSFNYSVYFISAHTTTPSVFYCSYPDSGYSVDNIAPCTPILFTGEQQYDPEGLMLSWDDNSEPDLACYDLYRGTRKDFTPDKFSHVASPCDNRYLDPDWNWEEGYWYKVAAVDIHGNVSEFALLGPDLITGDDPLPVPDVTFLSQNWPNPFNPITNIGFGIKKPAHVSLRIYDAAGRLVAVLIDESRPAGRYEAIWNGTGDAGSAVASGVYFYMLKAGSFEETRKMILLR